MDIKKVIETLHPLEQKILPYLRKYSKFDELVKVTNLTKVEVMRALQWLQNKGVLRIKEEIKEVIKLDINGIRYIKLGLPERRFLNALKHTNKLSEIIKRANLNNQEVNLCLGFLKRKAAIIIQKKEELYVELTPQGENLLKKESLEERFLKKRFPVLLSELKPEEKYALESLKKRSKIIKIELLKIKNIELTNLGKELVKYEIKVNAVDSLTPEMLKTGSWRSTTFRRYDIRATVPKIHGGKKQHYRRFLDEVREKFLALGFTEMFGPIVETNFWNMDALFMPQFHSARDIHQAYYVKEPKYLPLDKKLVEKVKKAHETGVAGSKGWRYKFDVKFTHRTLLRTQGTAVSARMIASKQLKIPGKYFAIARCFRYDVIDATHLVDFNQVEGIVVEEGLNFRHLKGLLKMFAKEFAATDKIKITPAYFPFTEPSAELHAKHPELGWIELAGSGIFRPEMCEPLGVNVPVLAWGIGIDRIAMFKFGLRDIRELFSHNLEFLRNVKIV